MRWVVFVGQLSVLCCRQYGKYYFMLLCPICQMCSLLYRVQFDIILWDLTSLLILDKDCFFVFSFFHYKKHVTINCVSISVQSLIIIKAICLRLLNKITYLLTYLLLTLKKNPGNRIYWYWDKVFYVLGPQPYR